MSILGPLLREQLVRDGLALGCDEGLRVWDDDLDDLHVHAKALILARVARILTFDLLLFGARSRDTASSQMGILLASSMGLPCIARAIDLGIEGEGTIVATRRLAEGYQERVESATASRRDRGGIRRAPVVYATFSALLDASEREIPCLSLSEIGIPQYLVREMESRLSFGTSEISCVEVKVDRGSRLFLAGLRAA